jgi:hypothetical protein
MVDIASTGLICVVKIVRAMVFWVALYVAEKVFQDTYVQQVLAQDQDPPDLTWMVPYALSIDLLVMSLVCVITVLLKEMYKFNNNTFVLDGALIRCMALDYLTSTGIILCLGVLLSRMAQTKQLFRYRDDGLRGIRAVCDMMLPISFVVIAFPHYRLY